MPHAVLFHYLRLVRDVALDLLAPVKVLLSLVPGEAVPMRFLAERLDYDASNLTTLVDRLQRRGAVERRTDPVDRPVKALVFTPEGEQLRQTFWHDLIEIPARYRRSMSARPGSVELAVGDDSS